MKPLFVDADIRKAETLPTSFYTDLDYFEAAKAKIFEMRSQTPEFPPTGPPTSLNSNPQAADFPKFPHPGFRLP